MPGKVLTNTFYSSVNVYLEYFLGLVVSILIARSLGPSEYGNYTYLIWIASFCIILTNAGISTGAIKFFAELRASDKNNLLVKVYSYFRRYQLVKVAVVLLVLSLLVSFFPQALGGGEYISLIWILMLGILFKSYHMYRVGVLKGFERFDYLAFTVILTSPLNLVLAIIAFIHGVSLTTYIYIYVFICGVYWLSSSLYIKKVFSAATVSSEPSGTLDQQLKSRINHHLKVVSINSVIGFVVFGQSELFFLKHFSVSESLAYFNIGYAVSGAAMMLVPGVYASVLLPLIAGSVADDSKDPAKEVKNSTRYLFALGVLVACPIAYYASDIIVLLYGESFEDAAWVLRVFILLAVVKNSNQAANAYLLSIDKQSFLLKITLVALLASVLLDFFLIKYWGLTGAVVAYVMVNLTVSMFVLIYTFNKLSAWPNFWVWSKIVLCGVLALLLGIIPDIVLDNKFDFIVGGIIYVFAVFFFLLKLDALEKVDYIVVGQLLNKLSPRLRSSVESVTGKRLH